MSERSESTAVIVLLAAGESRRYGGIKQLADIDGEPMVRRVARIALESGARVVVVTGANAEKVSAVLADLPLLISHHGAWAEGMGSSLAAGIREVHRHSPLATGALLCLADQPLLKTSWYVRMLARHQQKPDRILATEQSGVTGPPVLFPQDCFDELIHWSGNRGAQALLQREADRVELFTSEDNIDVDSPDDLKLVQSWLASNRLA